MLLSHKEKVKKSLEAKSLCKSFSSRKVVSKVSLSVNKGEVVGLLGPNGAGKTTSFYIMIGLLTPDFGRVFLGSKEITELPMYKRARAGIGYLPQNTSIFRKLTVEQNLLAVMQIIGTPSSDRNNILEKLLEKFHIKHIARSYGLSLSGGERRRVEIARALVSNPDFLLLDEPFAGVDPVTVQEIQEIIQNLSREEGLGVLITDHNVRDTLRSCHRSYVLSQGEVIAHGGASSIVENKQVRQVYLGEKFSL